MKMDQLRLLLKELGFDAKGTTVDGEQVIYMNEKRNKYFKVFIPIKNYADRNLANRVIRDLIERFNYAEIEIVEAANRIPKPPLISN